MVVIYIMIIHDVPIEEEMATVLCDALLLRTPGEDHICHDFEAVNTNFPEFKTYVHFDIIERKKILVFGKVDNHPFLWKSYRIIPMN